MSTATSLVRAPSGLIDYELAGLNCVLTINLCRLT